MSVNPPAAGAVPAERRRAVVVDDEPALAALVASYLEKDGFEVWQAGTGPEALAQIREHAPDVVVLDLSLPGLDGIEVARQLRVFSDAYLIMLTARAEEVDKLIGLAVGADDYMTKPFSPRELAARVRALLRRPRSSPMPSAGHPLPPPEVPPAPPPLRVGDLVIDVAAREVRRGGSPVELTRTEFDLLAALAASPGVVFGRERLLRAVWGADWVGDPHAADVHLAHVRRKLGDTASDQRYVRTVRGVGYRIGAGG
ncbi:MAG: response regulator transcription factor [Bifidobacteriaceae bacterium]|jgi:DNA-binding response OmpR family regulator|nr:response regulator transcription factor [Bifidobacteriaceae bacterium]